MFNKFGARKIWVLDGVKIYEREEAKEKIKKGLNVITFDSEMEANYYLMLLGNVKNLKIHPQYLLQPEFEKNGEFFNAIYYEADFEFIENGIKRIVDIKGMETDEFLLKRKLFEYKYPDLHLEVLKYSKTTGWVELMNYKKIMKEKRKEKQIKANETKKQLSSTQKSEEKILKEIKRLKELISKEKEHKLTKVERERKESLFNKYKDFIIY